MVRILTVNAAVNLVISSLLIPVVGIYGAVIGTVAAETVGFVTEVYICRKYISIKSFFTNGIPFAIIGAVMFACVKLVAHFFDGSIKALLVQILVGIAVYGVLTVVYAFMFNDMLRRVIVSCLNKIKSIFVKKGEKR